VTVADQDVTTGLDRLAPALLAGLPQLFDELQLHLADLDSDYSDFIAQGRELVLFAAERAVRLLIDFAATILDGVESGIPAEGFLLHEGEAGHFEEIGRVQCREGVPVATLLSAYQLGARVWWRQMSETALSQGLEPPLLAALAESLFCFVDQLCTASAAGYLAEQVESSAARERSRDELVELLLSERSTMAAIRAAAVRARWPVPANVAIILIDPHNEIGRQRLTRLDGSCLIVRTSNLLGAIVADPDAPGHRQRLASMLAGSSAVIGHSVDPQLLPATVRVAEVAAQLQADGVLSEDPIFVDENVDAIIVHRDPGLLESLSVQCLEPLANAPAASREALLETLRSWLRNMGDHRAIAAELHIHPQTVRYRLSRLRELFGDTLDDPRARLRLTLAVSWRRQ
jgi:hypothetical protein